MLRVVLFSVLLSIVVLGLAGLPSDVFAQTVTAKTETIKVDGRFQLAQLITITDDDGIQNVGVSEEDSSHGTPTWFVSGSDCDTTRVVTIYHKHQDTPHAGNHIVTWEDCDWGPNENKTVKVSFRDNKVGTILEKAITLGNQIPPWIKTTSDFWASGAISDDEFVNAMKFLLQEKIIPGYEVPEKSDKSESNVDVPHWIKQNAGWWSEGSIDDNSFLSGIDYMLENKIIDIPEIVKLDEKDDIDIVVVGDDEDEDKDDYYEEDRDVVKDAPEGNVPFSLYYKWLKSFGQCDSREYGKSSGTNYDGTPMTEFTEKCIRDGKVIGTTTWKYDSNGNLVRVTQDPNPDTGKGTNMVLISWIDGELYALACLNSDGTIIQYIQKDENGDYVLVPDKDNQKVEKRFRESSDNKISEKIFSIFENTSPNNRSQELGAVYSNGKLGVTIVLEDDFGYEIEQIQSIGLVENRLAASLTLEQIRDAAKLDSVKHIILPSIPVSSSHFIGEGVSLINADTYHALGTTGNGVIVAILDTDFILNDPEISSNIVDSQLFDIYNHCNGDISCGMPSGYSHGNAVAEIIVDIAPDVELLLYTVKSDLDFRLAVEEAILNNAQIISVSMNFPESGSNGVSDLFRDGTSFVAQTVDYAKNSQIVVDDTFYKTGIFVTIAAANDATNHWSGFYDPVFSTGASSGIQSFMNFRPNEQGFDKICLPINPSSWIVATWDDWLGHSQDYDMYVFDRDTRQLIDYSINTGYSLESIRSPTNSNACLVIVSNSSSEDHFFHIYANGGISDPNLIRPFGSIGTPADAVGAFSVGAVNHLSDSLESFSSRGVTDDGRDKPEICGPDGVSSHQTGSLNPFYGTSAATPHVAGAAALLLDQDPSLIPVILEDVLMNEAKENSSYSINNYCDGNSGLVHLPAPIVKTNSFCLVPYLGLVSWWDGDVVSGVIAGDIEDGNDGIMLNGVSTSRGMVRDGFSFDGIDDYILVANNPNLNFGTNDFTINLWVKTSYLGGTANDVIIGKASNGPDLQYAIGYRANTNGHPFFAMQDPITGDLMWAEGVDSLSDGQLHHIAAVRDGLDGKLYVDGQLVSHQIAPSLISATSTNNVTVGGREYTASDPYFNGIVDEVQIFDRALTDLEIMQIYDAKGIGQCKN